MPDALLGGIIINEVLVDPNGTNNFDTDGSGVARGGDEFIEFKNISASAIDISGLELWDAGRDNWFTFPPGTILQPGALAVVVRIVQNTGSLPTVTGDDLAFDADFGSNVFNNGGDNIVVYDPTNDEFIQATYNGDSLDDPTTGSSYAGFSSTATRVGSSEDFGNDIDGFSIQREAGVFSNNSTPTPGTQNLCFTSGTRIETPLGFTAIEHLSAGDLVQTLDAGFQPIRWIFASDVSAAELAENSELRPICVPQQHVGARPLRVSRHHRLMVEGKIVQRMFGQDQILVPAKDMMDAGGVHLDESCGAFSYFHILLDGHHILNAEGFAAESLLLADQTLKVMSGAAKRNLDESLADACEVQHDHPARLLARGGKVQNLAARHCKHGRQVVAGFESADRLLHRWSEAPFWMNSHAQRCGLQRGM